MAKKAQKKTAKKVATSNAKRKTTSRKSSSRTGGKGKPAKTAKKKAATGVKAVRGKTVRKKKAPSAKNTAAAKKSVKKSAPALKVKEDDGPLEETATVQEELSPQEYEAIVQTAAKEAKVDPEEVVTVDRRRKKKKTDSPPEKMERRKKVQRRRQIDPTTCERDYSDDEIEFMNALDEYKRNSGRMFPTCSEILEVLRGIGYVKLDSSGADGGESAAPELEETQSDLETGEPRGEGGPAGSGGDSQDEPTLLLLPLEL